MRRSRHAAVIASVVALSSAAAAQRLPFEVLGLSEGLPQSQVVSLAQDRDGYIWVGTLGGLARFDGAVFTAFSREDGLPGIRIQELFVDRDGVLWIAAEGGLAVWRDHRLAAVDNDPVREVRCRALAEDTGGRLWVGTDRGVVVRRGDRLVALAAPPQIGSQAVFDIIPDGDGVLVAATRGVFRYAVDGTCVEVPTPPLPPDSFRSLARSDEGLWLGTFSQGLWRRSPAGQWRDMREEGFRGEYVYRLAVDEDGTLFVATQEAGVSLRRPGGSFRQWTVANGLPANVVNCTLRDHEGNLWIGADVGGLARLGTVAVSNYGEGTGLPSSCAFGITPSSRPGALWIGTLRGAALLEGGAEPRVVETVTAADGLLNELVFEVVETPEGETWFYTDSGAFVRPRGGRRVENPGASLAPPLVEPYDIGLDNDKRLWIVGRHPRGGVSVRDASGRWHVWDRTADGRPLTSCTTLAIRAAGGMWVAASEEVLEATGNGPPTWAARPPLPGTSHIGAMLEDTFGRLWVGNDSGLARRESDGSWNLLNGTPGLASHQVYFVGEDRERTVWVGTARGAYLFSPDGTVRPFLPDDGLASYETNQGGFYCDGEGHIWLGTVDGLSRYDSQAYRPNPVPARAVVEGAEFAGTAVPFPTRLDLSWGERSVTFRVAVLAYRGHPRAGYRARLEGVESEWLPLRSSPELRYTNLPPGSHTLFVQAVNESGVWGDVVTVPVSITPPFWLTWWFRSGAVLLAVAAGVAAHQWRTVMLRRRARHLEEVVATRTHELREANAELERLATHEPLTGLPNRRASLDRLREELSMRKKGDVQFGCIIVDLDNFKKANDTLGHGVGDQVLCTMAAKIRDAVREFDHVGRYGGDEFLVILPHADRSAVDSAANRIAALTVTVSGEAGSVTVGASCGGVAVSGRGARDEAVVLAVADALLYEAKRAGKGTCAVDAMASMA